MPDKLPRIGFVGLGRMGSNMARRLKACAYPIVALYDLHRVPALAEELGAPWVTLLSEVTRLSDIIITVVSDDTAMHRIYPDPQQQADSLWTDSRGKLFINCATITPEIHINLSQTAKSYGAQVLETPMVSSIPQALAGTLFMVCAGDEAVYQKAQPLLQALATRTVFTGVPGTAAQLKALINMVMNINTAALAEGLGLANALGLDLTLVRQVFAESGANSRVLETDGEDMQNRDHDTYFSAAHAAKDSGIALELGIKAGLTLPLATATKAQYDRMVQTGLGDLDKSGISELTFKSRGNL